MLQKTLTTLAALSAILNYTHGFQEATMSLCGTSDNSVPAKCYMNGSSLATTLPLAYERSLPVARLALPDSYYCTGFLVGSEGHLLTAGSCIPSAAVAGATDFEFGAESASCADECKKQLGCKGTILRTTSELVVSSLTPDYALVKLAPGADLAKYGYLQVREGGGAVVGESVYVPGHPSTFAKRIAAYTDGVNPARVVGLGVTDNCGHKSIAHNADTQGGSSGSPLIAWADNLVIGFHTCTGCSSTGGTNGAMDMRDILADLAAKNIKIKDFVFVPPPPATTAPPPTTTAPPPTTTAPPPPTTAPPVTTTTPSPSTTAPPPTATAPPPTTTVPAPTSTAPPPTTSTPPPTTSAPLTRAPGYCP